MADVTRSSATDAPALVCSPSVLDPALDDSADALETPSEPAALVCADPALAADAFGDFDYYQQLVASDVGLPWVIRIRDALMGLMSQWQVEDVRYLQEGPIRTFLARPEEFMLAALEAYSRYVLDALEAALEWIGSIAQQLLGLPSTVMCLGSSSMQQLVAFAFGEETAGTVASQLVEACPDVAPVLKAFDAVSQFVAQLRELAASVDSAGWDDAVTFLAELVLAGVELAGEAVVKEAFVAFVDDPVALGRVVGTIAGVLMWEIISTVATAGLNKVAALGRVGLVVAKAVELGI